VIGPLLANHDSAIVNELIAAVAVRDRTRAARQAKLFERTRAVDRSLASDWDDCCGSLMGTYGSAGFHVGVAMGLELTALVAAYTEATKGGPLAPLMHPRRQIRRKDSR
jgi:hypothetical protein